LIKHSRSLRLWLAMMFFAIVTAGVFLGLISVWSLSHFNAVSTDVRDRWLPDIRLLGDLNNFTSDYRTAEANTLVAAGPSELSEMLRGMEELDRSVGIAQVAYGKIRHGSEETMLYQRFNDSWTAYKVLAAEVTGLAAGGHTADAVTLYRTTSRASFDLLSDLLGQLTDYNVRRAAEASEQSVEAYTEARVLLFGALALAAFMLGVVVVKVHGLVSKPLLVLAEAMRRLADRDLAVPIGYTERLDEIGVMARAVVVFRDNAIELTHSQQGLAQQATMLEEKLAYERSVTQAQHNFVSMISHEFRTPLTQIDAQAQRLVSLRDRLSSGDIVERATRIRASVTRAVQVIDSLLEASRLMEGDARMFFHPEQIDLVAVLRDVCRTHREIAPQAQILDDFSHAALPLWGDPKLLFQALSNLVSNAIKYSMNEPRIVVRARLEGELVLITVKDRGIGIAADDLGRIFSRYYRGSNVSGQIGTGIGLFLVTTVVRLHAGEITVESQSGEGSQFHIALPVAVDTDRELAATREALG